MGRGGGAALARAPVFRGQRGGEVPGVDGTEIRGMADSRGYSRSEQGPSRRGPRRPPQHATIRRRHVGGGRSRHRDGTARYTMRKRYGCRSG